MLKLQELRESLSDEQRGLLNEMWNHFRSEREWPIAWDFHAPSRKAAVRDALGSLSVSIVFISSDGQRGGRYQLTLLGVLLTSEGPILEKLLVRYFDFMRTRYQARRKDRMILSSEVQPALQLDDEETKILGRLIILGSIYSESAGYDSKWDKKDWNAGIFQDVEDFSSEGSLDGEIERLALNGYNPDRRVFWQEEALANLRNPQAPQSPTGDATTAADPRTVFVVHGRNEALRKSMFDFLRAIGLLPLEWSQAISATGEATPYIGQVLDTAFSIAQAVVVLMTPDDEAFLRKEFQSEHDPEYEKQPTGQARPNVLFEAGMAMGRNPKRTVLVQIGYLRPFSDVGGRHVLRLDDSSQRRQDLAERLRTSGCFVNTIGTDWHTVGSFNLKPSETPLREKAEAGTNQLQQPPQGLSAESEKILLRIANSQERITREEAAEGLKLSKAKTDHLFDQLKEHDFIRISGARIGGPIHYSATSEGRKYLANAGLL